MKNICGTLLFVCSAVLVSFSNGQELATEQTKSSIRYPNSALVSNNESNVTITSTANSVTSTSNQTPPGCPRTYLYSDGTYFAYEEVGPCATSLFTGNCDADPTGRVLLYSSQLSPTGCAFTLGGGGVGMCGCSNNTPPAGIVGGGELAYSPLGKPHMSTRNANMENFSEFVAKDTTNNLWYKFTSGDIRVLDLNGNQRVLNLRQCFLVNPADGDLTTKICANAGGEANCVPKEWFTQVVTVKAIIVANQRTGKVEVTHPSGFKEIFKTAIQ